MRDYIWFSEYEIPIKLFMHYLSADAPTCHVSQQKVHGVAKQERAHIVCKVDANPPEVTVSNNVTACYSQ